MNFREYLTQMASESEVYRQHLASLQMVGTGWSGKAKESSPLLLMLWLTSSALKMPDLLGASASKLQG